MVGVPVTLGKTKLSTELQWHILPEVHCTGWNNCWELKQILLWMDVLFLMNDFRLYPWLKLLFQHSSARKNLFLTACFCWDSRLSLREMDQKFLFGANIGYGDSYLESIFRIFKVFRLHAFLHNAAGAARAHSDKSPGYCYYIGRGLH